MPSTDANGIVQVLTGDSIAPIQTLLNGISASISTAITSLKKDVLVKATSLSDANSKRPLWPPQVLSEPQRHHSSFIGQTQLRCGRGMELHGLR